MKKARRYLGLFLASVLSLSNIPTINAWADSGVTSLKVSVVGGGTVVLDDYESKYSLEDGDVFKANCTVDTQLKISLNANEGNSIEGVTINGEVNQNITKGEKSTSFDYSVPSNGGDIKITFSKDEVVPPTTNDNKVIENTKPTEDSKPVSSENNEDKSEDKVTEETSQEEKKISDEASKIIAEYESGNYGSSESLEFRKSLVSKHKLDDYVDSSFFFKEEYIDDLVDKYLGDVLTLIKLSPINNILNTSSEDIRVNSRYNLLSRYSLFSISANSSERSSVVVMRPNHNNISAPENTVSYYENGYFMGRTGVFSVNGRAAFCSDHRKTDPPSGTPLVSIQEISNDTMRKVLYYGSEGPAQIGGWTYSSLRLGTSMALSILRNGESYTMGKRLINAVSGMPSPPASFKAYFGSPANPSLQTIAYWEFNPKGSLQISKSSANPSITDGNNCYDITGAEYGVFTGSNATRQVATLVIGSNGWSQEISLDSGTYYIKETKAPKGYALDGNIYPITVNSGSKATKAFTDRPLADPIALLLRKVDNDTGSNKPQGSGSLADAHFTFKFYAGEYSDGVNPSDLGVSPTRTWVMRTDESGYTRLGDSYKVSGDPFYYNGTPNPTLPKGTLTVQETKAPVGYKINNEVFVRKITENSGGIIPTFNEVVVKEDSLDFTIRKIQSGTDILLPNVKFKHTKPDGSFEELTTNPQGEIVIRGLVQGTHKIVETKTTDGFEVNPNEFVFEVTSSNTIRVISNTTNMGMTYIENEGNGVLTVENTLRPFQLKVVKVNDKGTALKGAEFTLYSDRDCRNEIGKAVSNDRGELFFDGLKVGTPYYFKETKAPEGYRIPVDSNGKVHVYEVITESQPSNGIFNFTVDGVRYTADSTNGDIHIEGNKNDRVISIKVVNYISMKLPTTGSGAMLPMLVIGMALMGFAFVMNKRSKKENN